MIISSAQDNGRKRHIAVDTTGLLLVVLVTGAGVQDRHGGRLLLWALAGCFARISMVWVDGGYSGAPVDDGTALGLVVQVVAKLAGQIGFTVLPRRWVVERTFAWINRCRRTGLRPNFGAVLTRTGRLAQRAAPGHPRAHD